MITAYYKFDKIMSVRQNVGAKNSHTETHALNIGTIVTYGLAKQLTIHVFDWLEESLWAVNALPCECVGHRKQIFVVSLSVFSCLIL